MEPVQDVPHVCRKIREAGMRVSFTLVVIIFLGDEKSLCSVEIRIGGIGMYMQKVIMPRY